MTHPMADDFDPATQELLLDHQHEHWRKTKGWGIEPKKGSKLFLIGAHGDRGLEKMTLSLSLAAVAYFAVKAATGHELGWPVFMALSLATAPIPNALQGVGSAWRHAREQGGGSLAALRAASRKAGARYTGRLAEVLSCLPIAAVGIPTIGADWIHGKTPANSWMEKASGWAASKLADGTRKSFEWQEQAKRWSLGALKDAASLDGASAVFAEAYAEMIDSLLVNRWRLVNRGDDMEEGVLAHLPPAEAELRERRKVQVKELGWTERAYLANALDRLDAVGVQPWQRPEPRLPSLAELAAAVNRRCDGWEGPDPDMQQRLAGMEARVEAWDIQASMGRGIPTATPARAKARL